LECTGAATEKTARIGKVARLGRNEGTFLLTEIFGTPEPERLGLADGLVGSQVRQIGCWLLPIQAVFSGQKGKSLLDLAGKTGQFT